MGGSVVLHEIMHQRVHVLVSLGNHVHINFVKAFLRYSDFYIKLILFPV